MEIYLNDFRVKQILEIVAELKSMKIKDLIFKIENDNSMYATMLYIPYLHRIDVNSFDPEKEPVFPNPSAIVKLMPRDSFIKAVIPDKMYKTLMESK